MKKLQFLDLGSTHYNDVFELQKNLVEKRIKDAIADTILFTEHHHVITVGRKLKSTENIINPQNVPIIEVDRGGDVTYHGPGQLVFYPIIKLDDVDYNLDFYLRSLEQILILVLANWGIKGTRKPGLTGVWVQDKKIASIGISVKKWVTYHGAAININTDMSYFNLIKPCGLNPDTMISMHQITRKEIPISQFKYYLMKEFENVYHRKGVIIKQSDLPLDDN